MRLFGPGTPERDWLESVKGIVGYDLAKAVRAKLEEINAGVAAKHEYKLTDGVVTEWTITGERLAQIWPLLALSGLKTLWYDELHPREDAPVLREIASLETLNKRSAELYRQVFPPGRKFPVVDQAWVEEVKQIADPATRIQVMMAKLHEANPEWDQQYEYFPIGGGLTINNAEFLGDLGPLIVLPENLVVLRTHSSQGDHVFGFADDLSPLTGSRLANFSCSALYIRDLSPLADLPLEHLSLVIDDVLDDITPLRDLKRLTFLSLYGSCDVTDLTPLSSLPLENLRLYGGLQVSDLSPLRGMDTLTIFKFRGKGLNDISPLADLPLEQLVVPFVYDRDAEILRSIKTLETINDMPVAEFWKQFEPQSND
jgi:hypothetical protein